jgi:hypothetical protein
VERNSSNFSNKVPSLDISPENTQRLLLLLLLLGLLVFCSVKILTNHSAKILHYCRHVIDGASHLIRICPTAAAAVSNCVGRFQHLYHIIIRNKNSKTQQRNMSYQNRRPASEALEHSGRIETPPRMTATLSTSSLKFDMTKLFHAAQQDSMQFPIIAWASDDDENDSTASGSTSSSEPPSNEEEKKEETPNCKLTTNKGLSKRPREDSEGAHRMVRSKALYSELSLLSSSFSTSRGLPTQINRIAAHLA